MDHNISFKILEREILFKKISIFLNYFYTLNYANMFACMPLQVVDNHRRPGVNGINICGAACMAVPTGG